MMRFEIKAVNIFQDDRAGMRLGGRRIDFDNG